MSEIEKDSPEYFRLRDERMDRLKIDLILLIENAGITGVEEAGREGGFHFILDGDPYYAETIDEFVINTVFDCIR